MPTATTASTTTSTLVQALAANRWLDRATGDLRRFMRLWRGRQLQLPGRIAASLNEHRVLMDAMHQRDADRAEPRDARPPDGPAHRAEGAASPGRTTPHA
jgi:hypothetical protein